MQHSIRAVLAVVAMATLGLAACDDVDGVDNPPPPRVSIRFVNMIVDAQGNVLLTANSTRIGSALAFGTAATTCPSIEPGTTSLAFGAANASGTAIANSFGTLTHEFTEAGDFTVIATGIAASSQLLIFNDEPVPMPAAGNAAVRFLNAVPGTAVYDVYATAPGAILETPVVTNLTFGTTANAFVELPLGSTQITFTTAGTKTVVLALPALLTLVAGDATNVMLAPRAGLPGFQALTVTRC